MLFKYHNWKFIVHDQKESWVIWISAVHLHETGRGFEPHGEYQFLDFSLFVDFDVLITKECTIFKHERVYNITRYAMTS